MPGKKKYTLGQATDKHDLTLPSGATCQARRPGVQGLIDAGVLDNFDELTALVKTQHIDTKSIRGTPKVSAADTIAAVEIFKNDGAKLHSALLLMDKLVVYVVTEPKVWIDYQMKDESDEDWARRQKEATNPDSPPQGWEPPLSIRVIDLDDKSFLLQWAVGGSADVTSFREGREELMANLAPDEAI